MFVIAGVQPKTTQVDSTPRLCPACGLAQARLKRIDHYFSLFFIPLLRVKKGEEVLVCERCNSTSALEEPTAPSSSQPHPPPRMCRQCGRSLAPEFIFCPYCGQRYH